MPSRIPGLPHRARICCMITSICLLVSSPPALSANAGIAVPRTPLAMALRIARSSARAMYTGSARAIAAPPRPFPP